MLFAISITGLALTASSMWLAGAFYGFLSILHAITVIGALLYLPFGKFFHIFQRPAQLGVKLYQAHPRVTRESCAPLWRPLCVTDADRRSAADSAPIGIRLPYRRTRGDVARALSGLQARVTRDGAVANEGTVTWLSRRSQSTPGDSFGPHLNYEPPGGWEESTRRPVDRLVKTHCSFCGMQCGIQLKVRDDQVVGFGRGGVSVQPRHALPERCEALPAGGTSGPAAHVTGTDTLRLLADRLRRRAGARGAALSEVKEKYGADAVAVYGAPR